MDEDRVREWTGDTKGQTVMPFYVVTDVSYSMVGAMTALNDGAQRLRRSIVAQPVVDDVAQICVMWFSDDAQVHVPLQQMSETPIPPLGVQGGTNYGAAFRLLAKTITSDIAALKGKEYKVFRPCAFFLTDGVPGDSDWFQTFTATLTYDRASGQGLREHPLFIPFGFGDADEAVLKRLAYPQDKGKWYNSTDTSPEDALAGITGLIMKTVINSSLSVQAGQPQTQLQAPALGSGIVAGDSEYDPNWV